MAGTTMAEKEGAIPMNKNDPAFPTLEIDNPGLTKREYFAAKAMEGIMESLVTDKSGDFGYDFRSKMAVKQADALSKALEETK